MDRLAKRIRALSPSQTLAIGARAKAMKEAGENVISFGVGEPDFPTPPRIIGAAEEALARGCTHYTPSAGLPALRRAIAEKLRRDNGLFYEPSQIIVTCGAKHAVFNTIFALVDEGDEVLIPSPYWLTYPEAVRAAGGVPVFVNTKRENGFRLTPRDLEEAITPRTKLLIFNSPCNPTGAVYPEEEVRALAEVCVRAGIFVLSDEIYEKLVYGGAKPFSFAACGEEAKALTVTVNGLSKTYAMTGWRIGYLAAPPDIAAAIDAFQSHSTGNANSVAQYAAIEALSRGNEEEMLACFAERRREMLARIADMGGADCVEPDGAFYVMLRVSGVYGKRFGGKVADGSVAFADALLTLAHVAVVPGLFFGADDCVRLSYALSMEDIREGLSRIDAFLRSAEG